MMLWYCRGVKSDLDISKTLSQSYKSNIIQLSSLSMNKFSLREFNLQEIYFPNER